MAAVQNTTINYLYPFSPDEPQLIPRMAGWKRKKWNTQPAQVHDIRPNQDAFHLDKQGFQILPSPYPDQDDFNDPELVTTKFYTHVTDLLKKELGCSKVFILAHQLRKRTWEKLLEDDKDNEDTNTTEAIRDGHLHFAHVDYSYSGATKFVELLRDQTDSRVGKMLGPKDAPQRNPNLPTPEELEKLQGNRWAMINLWQPIHHTVTRDGLAVADARSIPEGDLFEDLPETIRDVKKFGTWYLAAPSRVNGEAVNTNGHANGDGVHGGHKWYYQSDMRTDEALLIKCFDSKLDGRARRCPHTAFSGDGDYGELPRESIEVRTLVCWGDEEAE